MSEFDVVQTLHPLIGRQSIRSRQSLEQRLAASTTDSHRRNSHLSANKIPRSKSIISNSNAEPEIPQSQQTAPSRSSTFKLRLNNERLPLSNDDSKRDHFQSNKTQKSSAFPANSSENETSSLAKRLVTNPSAVRFFALKEQLRQQLLQKKTANINEKNERERTPFFNSLFDSKHFMIKEPNSADSKNSQGDSKTVYSPLNDLKTKIDEEDELSAEDLRYVQDNTPRISDASDSSRKGSVQTSSSQHQSQQQLISTQNESNYNNQSEQSQQSMPQQQDQRTQQQQLMSLVRPPSPNISQTNSTLESPTNSSLPNSLNNSPLLRNSSSNMNFPLRPLIARHPSSNSLPVQSSITNEKLNSELSRIKEELSYQIKQSETHLGAENESRTSTMLNQLKAQNELLDLLRKQVASLEERLSASENELAIQKRSSRKELKIVHDQLTSIIEILSPEQRQALLLSESSTHKSSSTAGNMVNDALSWSLTSFSVGLVTILQPLIEAWPVAMRVIDQLRHRKKPEQ